MEQRLGEEARRGNVVSLHEIIGDGKILDKIVEGSFNWSPLHVAASRGHTQFVQQLLNSNSELAGVFDSEHRSALHLASAKGYVEIVKALIQAKPEMCLSRDRDGRNPLHIAVKYNQEETLILLVENVECYDLINATDSNGNTLLHVAVFNNKFTLAKLLLDRNVELAEALNSQHQSALHLASAKGYIEIVEALININPNLCLVCDRDGRNPLHIAAIKGQVNVLQVLVRVCPQAVRVTLDRDETILHLCVNHNQQQALEVLLKVITSRDFVNAKDRCGNNILHLATLNKQLQMARCVLDNCIIDENARNANNHTAMDVVLLAKKNGDLDHNCNTEDLLQQAHAKRAPDFQIGEWTTKGRDLLMAVATFVATLGIQSGVNPPGGVWQDNSSEHRAGQSILAYNHPSSYKYFLRANTMGFVASLSIFLLLVSRFAAKRRIFIWLLVILMWISITSTVFIIAVTPEMQRKSLSQTIVVATIVWCIVMALLLVHTYRLIVNAFQEKRKKDEAVRVVSRIRGEELPGTSTISDHENQSNV
ncbi:unnamed protein product [Camellia sinensis]